MYTVYCAGCGSEIEVSEPPNELTFVYCGTCPNAWTGSIYPGAIVGTNADGLETITLDKMPEPPAGTVLINLYDVLKKEENK